MKISSQRYINQETVDEKIAACDYTVTLATINPDYDLVIDGHHSLEAAKQTGVNPVYVYGPSLESECEYMGLDGVLEAHFMDSDWYDIETGENIF